MSTSMFDNALRIKGYGSYPEGTCRSDAKSGNKQMFVASPARKRAAPGKVFAVPM